MTSEKKLLDTFENPQDKKDYLINMRIPEFTCLCPKSGQPDFARFVIDYLPNKFPVSYTHLTLPTNREV